MSRIIDNALTDAKALYQAGLMDDVTLREIETLGLPPVKGPLGAFRVKDRVRVEIDQGGTACIRVVDDGEGIHVRDQQ